MSILRTFSVNAQGRDFVIGDLHGSYKHLQRMLLGINFNKEVDRLFSVGDLIDRGKNNLECLRLLKEPWFFSVMGNHEQLMLHGLTGGPYGMFWARNGGSWGMRAKSLFEARERGEIPAQTEDHESEEILSFVPIIQDLPFLITVQLKDGSARHIIHAEFITRSEITDEMLQNEKTVQRLSTMQTLDGDAVLWGRYLFYPFHKANLKNKRYAKQEFREHIKDLDYKRGALSPVISGHTIISRPLQVLGQTNIDTGAYKQDGYLTCIDLNENKFYKSTAKKFSAVKPLIL